MLRIRLPPLPVPAQELTARLPEQDAAEAAGVELLAEPPEPIVEHLERVLVEEVQLEEAVGLLVAGHVARRVLEQRHRRERRHDLGRAGPPAEPRSYVV